MRVTIAGSRSITDPEEVRKAVADSGFEITEVVSGAARGVDRLGEQWASSMKVPVKLFPADWTRYGKSAGFRRNSEMALYADALVAVYDGSSRGTAHMIRQMQLLGKPVHIHLVDTLKIF